MARAEAAKSRTSTAAFGAPIGGATRGPVLEPRRELAAPRLEPASRTGQHLASRPAAQMAVFNDPPVAAAMSAVREVDLDPQPVDPQGAIDRAIATLDREARGEPVGSDLDYDPVENDEDEGEDETPVANGFPAGILRADAPAAALGKRGKGSRDPKPIRERSTGRAAKVAQPAFPRAERERRGMGAVTIFLIVFAVLLVGAGGAGFWAWREGFVDLDQMFGRVASTEQQATVAKTPADGAADAPATGPGNTDTPSDSSTPAAELNQDERLGAETVPVADSPALPLLDPAPSEQRLGGDSQPAAETAEAAVAALDPANLAGSQSLLLEASDTGTTGAVPFSGTVEWSKGIDEMGVATLIGKANIPARNLGVDVLIRKNSDPSLPASHLMEVNFRVSDSFVGGSIAGLPGVLLKNEELVQGTPLVGASARVVGNSFLFALSASPEDITANSNLLTSRKWMDLALIYATGRRAIITLEKDEAAIAMFNAVVGSWGTAATASQ
ncbi:MAG: hypothetical protein IPK28_17225 [Devosia sp.]|nr:hypothetical protein [Devosia sp.]